LCESLVLHVLNWYFGQAGLYFLSQDMVKGDSIFERVKRSHTCSSFRLKGCVSKILTHRSASSLMSIQKWFTFSGRPFQTVVDMKHANLGWIQGSTM
jgi:hypothetical protein